MDDSGACACECDLDGDHGDSTDHNIEFTVLVQLLLLLRTGGPSPRGAAVPGTGLTNPETGGRVDPIKVISAKNLELTFLEIFINLATFTSKMIRSVFGQIVEYWMDI